MKARRIGCLQQMAVISLITVLALILGILVKGFAPLSPFSVPAANFTSKEYVTRSANVASRGFVTRSGSQLLLGGHPFRFAGANMHWLPFDDSTNYTSQFRINDGLDAAQEMGLAVVRSHDLGISVGCSNCIEPAPGVINETALLHDDYIIKAARDRGIRFIIPLTDNWHYPAGGKHTFTDWRGLSNENDFYYNAQVISDFESYIRVLLNHVNAYTGLAYKNDPTILAWETGNELQPPTSWTQTISTYIKSIDGNHLVLDGRSGVDPNAVQLSDVDIVSAHYYPKSISQMERDAANAERAGKVFIVGEFDWNDANGGDSLTAFLSAIESDPDVAGDLFWELWSHADQFGYVSNGTQYTLHYPGDSESMRTSVSQLRLHAFKMRGLAVPAYHAPGTPLITAVRRGGPEDMLIWRGATLAASYTVERSTEGVRGPWKVICDQCATDTSTPWADTTAPGGVVWYRVIAFNLAGVAGRPSSPYQAGSLSFLSHWKTLAGDDSLSGLLSACD